MTVSSGAPATRPVSPDEHPWSGAIPWFVWWWSIAPR